LVPEDKIKKEVSRHVSLSQRNLPGNIPIINMRPALTALVGSRPPTPVGLSFRTPSPILKTIGLPQEDLPWFQFQEIFDAIRLVGLPNDQRQAQVVSQGTKSLILRYIADP